MYIDIHLHSQMLAYCEVRRHFDDTFANGTLVIGFFTDTLLVLAKSEPSKLKLLYAYSLCWPPFYLLEGGVHAVPIICWQERLVCVGVPEMMLARGPMK